MSVNTDFSQHYGSLMVVTCTFSLDATIKYIHSYTNNGFLGNITSKGFDINGESFNLKEGKGSTTTGTNGTVATFNTSMWDNPFNTPSRRRNYGMWQKDGNVLEFDETNEDYLIVPKTYNTLGEVDISCEVNDLKPYSVYGTIFSFGNDISTAFFNFRFLNSLIYIAIRANDGDITESVSFSSSDIKDIKTASLKGSTLYINGVALWDGTAYASKVPLVGYEEAYVTFLGIRSQSSSYLFSGELLSAKVNSEKFLFREGKGVTTVSESGNTTATINTSHAGGVEYIDSEVWNESLDKWVGYK